MTRNNQVYKVEDVEFRVVYSRRRTLGIGVLPDSSVIVRVPYLTTGRTIERIVREKMDWIIKHRNKCRINSTVKPGRVYADGEIHLFRGKEQVLKLVNSYRPYVSFSENVIEAGLSKTSDAAMVKRLLYSWYKDQALKILPAMLSEVLAKPEFYQFKPSGLVVRTMKRRWGSCSNKGIITLSTELIKLSDRYIDYVIIHELCHLRHHNHGSEYYRLLSGFCPEYAALRKELRQYTQ